MIKNLFNVHWKFITKPSLAIVEDIPGWSVNYGIALFSLSLFISMVQNAKGFRLLSDIVVSVFEINSLIFLYFYILVMLAYAVFIQYYIQPKVLKILTRSNLAETEYEKYRLLIFYSYTATFIFQVAVTLPLQIVLAALLVDGDIGVLEFIMIGLTSFLGLWGVVCIINSFVIQWKGLTTYFQLSSAKKVLLIFVSPLIMGSPFILLFGQKYFEFIAKYI